MAICQMHYPRSAEGCFRCKIIGVTFDSSTMPGRKHATFRERVKESDRDKNLAAYRRLRESGVQPASTAQAANLERYSDTKFEIESGRRFGDAKRAKRVEKLLADTPPPTLPDGMMAK